MTIIYFSDGYKGGASTFLEQNIKYNLKNKKKVILVDKNFEKTFPSLKKNKYLKIYNLDIYRDKKIIKKKINSLKIKNQIFFFTNYAIFVFYFLFFISFKKQIDIVLTLHSGVFKYNIRNILGITLFSFLALRLNYLVFGSYSSKKWWVNKFPWIRLIKQKVIYNGIEKQQKKKINKNFLKVSFIGRLENENDPELFLKIASINKSAKNMKFNIFGDGTMKKKLIKKSENIKFWGWSEKSKIYSNTDIAIITSPVNNFPYVALESNSYGIPVISAAQGDIRKIVKNSYNGYIFNKRTAENFNIYLKKTIKNYKRLSKNSVITANKFDINVSCNKLWRFIKIENNNIR